MDKILPMFAEPIYKTNLKLAVHNEQYFARAKELRTWFEQKSTWLCDTYNTLGVYNVTNDSLFSTIVNETRLHVAEFAKEAFGIECAVNCSDAWFNVSDPGSHQEYHLHPNAHFSAVYYVSVPENSGRLVLRSSETQTDMFPLPDGLPTLYTNKTFLVSPKDGDLVIFRSNILHMVTKNYSDHERVSVAMNFEVK